MNYCNSKPAWKLQILLSTYNGGKYLQEQIESFRSIARICSYCVLIRDDGSTDDTRAILAQYAAEENIMVVYGENLGLNKSYGWLVRHRDVTCDYYAISDQDDRWMKEKMKIAAELLLEFSQKEGPILFASRSIVTDQNMRPVGITQLPVRGLNFYNAMLQNSCPGHTMILNRELIVLIEEYFHPDMINFDWWVYLTAAAFGEIIFSAQPTVYHRQHQTNTVGYGKGPDFYRRAFRVLSGEGKKVTRQLAAFYESTGSSLLPQYQSELKNFLQGQSSVIKRFKYFFRGKAYRQSKIDTFLFHCVYLFGGYCI